MIAYIVISLLCVIGSSWVIVMAVDIARLFDMPRYRQKEVLLLIMMESIVAIIQAYAAIHASVDWWLKAMAVIVFLFGLHYCKNIYKHGMKK